MKDLGYTFPVVLLNLNNQEDMSCGASLKTAKEGNCLNAKTRRVEEEPDLPLPNGLEGLFEEIYEELEEEDGEDSV